MMNALLLQCALISGAGHYQLFAGDKKESGLPDVLLM
jgi:hypothetical protein